jgi:hypothetical protein
MKMKRITITVNEERFREWEQAAHKMGLDRVSTLLRYLAARGLENQREEFDETADRRIVKVEVDNYREIDGYVRERKLGTVETFAAFAMDQTMKRYPLTAAQRRRVVENYEDDYGPALAVLPKGL